MTNFKMETAPTLILAALFWFWEFLPPAGFEIRATFHQMTEAIATIR
jgi:hypothetical protein